MSLFESSLVWRLNRRKLALFPGWTPFKAAASLKSRDQMLSLNARSSTIRQAPFHATAAARKAVLTLTAPAVERLKYLYATKNSGQDGSVFLRVGLKHRGCSGLQYDLDFVTKRGKWDEIVEQDGVKVLVDSKALISIIGSEMDFVQDRLSQQFIFKNPNVKESCGCGESFMV